MTMGNECMGNTLPVISINYSKLLKGFKKMGSSSEDFGSYCFVIVEIFRCSFLVSFIKNHGKTSYAHLFAFFKYAHQY